MAITVNEVKRLVATDSVVGAIEKEWDEQITREATRARATTFTLPFKAINDRPPTQDVVDALVARYKGAGWDVQVIPPNDDSPHVLGGITIRIP